MNCRICGIELTSENHERGRRKCFSCRYKQNKIKALIYAKKRYSEKHDSIRLYQKEYSQTIKGKEANRKRNVKHKNKRERNLGWIPLNKEFKNCEGHHIDTQHIIYLPKQLHQNIKHDLKKNQNMDSINTIAFFFLLQQNIQELI